MTIYGTLHNKRVILNNGLTFEKQNNETLPDFLNRVAEDIEKNHKAKLILTV